MTNTTGNSLQLQQHPLSAAFPSMPEQEVDVLAMDIENHGQREPGVIFEGMVLDGWHRYLACSKAGIEFKSVEYDGVDPVAFVISKNLHRRHLSATQRGQVVVACANWRSSGRPAKGCRTAPFRSVEEMAAQADVSPRTIQQVKQGHEAGLGEEMRAGKVSAEKAAKVAKLPKAKREKAVEAIRAGEEPPLPKAKAVVASREVEKLYEAAKAEIAELKESLANLADLAASAKAFEEKVEFKEMQVLREELRSCKRRRDELMAENAQLKTEVKRWRKKAGAK